MHLQSCATRWNVWSDPPDPRSLACKWFPAAQAGVPQEQHQSLLRILAALQHSGGEEARPAQALDPAEVRAPPPAMHRRSGSPLAFADGVLVQSHSCNAQKDASKCTKLPILCNIYYTRGVPDIWVIDTSFTVFTEQFTV